MKGFNRKWIGYQSRHVPIPEKRKDMINVFTPKNVDGVMCSVLSRIMARKEGYTTFAHYFDGEWSGDDDIINFLDVFDFVKSLPSNILPDIRRQIFIFNHDLLPSTADRLQEFAAVNSVGLSCESIRPQMFICEDNYSWVRSDDRFASTALYLFSCRWRWLFDDFESTQRLFDLLTDVAENSETKKKIKRMIKEYSPEYVVQQIELYLNPEYKEEVNR